MTQRYAGVLRRFAAHMEREGNGFIRAACMRQSAGHMENLQAAVDAIRSPWQPMKTAPKDGTAVLVLLDGSDIPHGARWLTGPNDPHATDETEEAGWHLTWDGHALTENDGPRYWMACPDDPDE